MVKVLLEIEGCIEEQRAERRGGRTRVRVNGRHNKWQAQLGKFWGLEGQPKAAINVTSRELRKLTTVLRVPEFQSSKLPRLLKLPLQFVAKTLHHPPIHYE